MSVKIGVIGGSGLNNPQLFTDVSMKSVSTPFGSPSDAELIEGKVNGIPCVLLARHGRNHSIMPSSVNYRANLLALKQLGCTHVLVSTACGSLREEIAPGDFVIIDQFIDRTTKRNQTFFDGSNTDYRGILHMSMGEPFCSRTRNILISTCKTLGHPVHSKGTIVTIEGPRFSSRAESNMFRTLGADIINMTTVPEVILAKELGLCYASIAMATDYDCWKEDNVVNVQDVLKVMKVNASKATEVLKTAITEIAKQDWTETIEQLKNDVTNNTMLPL